MPLLPTEGARCRRCVAFQEVGALAQLLAADVLAVGASYARLVCFKAKQNFPGSAAHR